MNNRICYFIPLLIFTGACHKDEITSTWVAKEAAPATTQQHSIQWTKPAAWTENAASSMRIASFSFKAKDGKLADISLIRLAGDGGGVLANINRWRGQLQMEPTTLSEMEKSLDQINVDGHPMLVTHLKHKGSAMLAAIYTLESESWYVKMTGDEKTLNEARPSFYEFIKSIRHPH